MNNIVWLASYPKSGNTWFRLFLSRLLYNKNQKDPLHLGDIPIATSRMVLDAYAGLELSDFSNDEIQEMRPEMYRHLSDQMTENVYLKIHDLLTRTSTEAWTISKEATKCIIYFVRNPLDIVASYAHHFNITIDKSIEYMCDENHTYDAPPGAITLQVQHKIGSWSEHIERWLMQTEMPILVVKYEDMVHHTRSTFQEVLDFIGLDVTPDKFDSALDETNFDKLKDAEKNYGFNEKFAKAKSFFRTGRTGGWKTELTSNQADKIIQFHGYMMKKLGYLD